MVFKMQFYVKVVVKEIGFQKLYQIQVCLMALFAIIGKCNKNIKLFNF